MKKTKLFERYHFIGVGGIGMSALALILAQHGITVSGSDVSNSPIIETLRKAGIAIYIGHGVENVPNKGAVVYSSAVNEDNPEMKEARARKIPILHRADLLASLLKMKKSLLVAGTHGKTTTSSLLAHLFIDEGMDPSFAIGGTVKNFDSNGHFGKGEYFIAEADESDGSFLKFEGYGAIITNIDTDHLDYWISEERLVDGFQEFGNKIASSEHLFWCSDDEKLINLNLRGVSYGFGKEAALRIENYRQIGWRLFFDFSFEGKSYENVEIPLIGAHNVLNAAAVFGLGLRCGISDEIIRHSFLRFQGVGRRADKKGEVSQIAIYDDYAHHPTEIFATLRALKSAEEGKRLVVVFQPHRYTRTRDCIETFPSAFEYADALILTDIYSAGEVPIPGISSGHLYEKIKSRLSTPVHYVPRAQLVSFLKSFLEPLDVLVTMGAGDVTKVGPDLINQLKQS